MNLLTRIQVHHIFRIMLIIGIIFLSPDLLAQKGKKTEISGTVTNESGEVITGAMIYSERSIAKAESSGNGTFTIETILADQLLIEAEGFKSITIRAESLQGSDNKIVLNRLPYQLSENDDVLVPFGTLKKRQMTGPAYTITAAELLDFDQRDGVLDALNTRFPGLFGNNNNRGIGQSVVIVDGIPRPADNINLHEVEEISYLPDAGTRMLYGAMANNGVIMIKTKRGHPYKKSITVSAEQGVSLPVSYPKFLNSYDYARLYNEASANDGLAPLYDSAALDAYRTHSNPLLYPDEQYYNDRYLRNYQPFSRVITELSGGNEQAQYYMNLGWNSSGNILTVGEGANERNDRFNIRGNVDFKVTDQIKMNVDIIGVFDRGHGPIGNFWRDAADFHPNYYPVLIDTTDVFIPNPDVLTRVVDGGYLLGGTSQYQSNIYGDLVSGGYVNRLDRIGQFNTGFDFDLNDILYGLTAKAYLSFDIYNFFRTIQRNDYAVYETSAHNQDLATISKIGEDNFTGNQGIGGVTFYRNIGYFGTMNFDRRFGDDHLVNATAVAYSDKYITDGEIHPDIHLHFGLRANYMYQRKYIVQFNSALPGSPKLAPGNRFSLSHSLGVAWVLSEEDFMTGSRFFNYLKFKASHSILNTDQSLNNYYMYSNNYEQGGMFTYADGQYGNNILRLENIGNPLLSYAKRRDLNVGFEASMMDYRLHLTANYFYSNSFDEVASLNNLYPAYLGGFDIYENFASYIDQGTDLGLNYSEQLSNLKLNVGINAVYSVPKVIKIDEPNYEYEYRKQEGKPTDAIFGWVAEGFFEDEDDIANSPVHTFGEVQPGDIKYQDLNDDNRIDENDQKVIGNRSSRVQLGLNIRLEYKNFEFFAQGICQGGANNIYNSEYYWVFGERKYSEVVLDRWTEETAATATYPRLSTRNNSNNFRSSTFWLVNDNYFNLRAVQLTYKVPESWMTSLPTSQIRVYARGQNLLTVSPSKEQRELNIGNSPQFRNYSFGIRLTF
ncbi:MAG: SusC/RagA family TonB-linked outer membrane protein [Bacteroidales bacterium]